MQNKILEMYKQAMLNKDEGRKQILSSLRAEIKNKEIELRSSNRELVDADILSLIQKMIKQRNDSVEMFIKGNREDLANKEKQEIRVLEEFLPKQLTKDELASIINGIIQNNSLTSPKDMGILMKELKEKYSGQYDGKIASELCKEMLGK